MTDEAQGHGPEDTPAPPTSTRWSEDAVQDDDAVAPPFVPGRRAAAQTGESEPARELAQEAAQEVTGEPRTVPETEPAGEEPFPFDAGEEAQEAAEGEEEGVAASAPEDDFPFDQFDIEGEGEEATDAVEGESPDMGWTPAELGLEETGEEVPEPEPEPEPEALAEPHPEPLSEPQPESIPEPYAEPAAPAASTPAPGRDAAEDAAALLDRLAGLLRTEGEEAVRREMESSDRLTAVLAGLLAGYVSGRS